MPGTKPSTVRRRKKKPPHLRKKLSTAVPVASTTSVVPTTPRPAHSQPVPVTPSLPVPATPSQPVPATPSQPVPATPSQPVPATPSQPVPATPSQPVPVTPSATPSRPVKISSMKKLSKSPHSSIRFYKTNDKVELRPSDSSGESKITMLEVDGLQSALSTGVHCSKCSSGPVVFKQNWGRQQGLSCEPYLWCESCGNETPIPFVTISRSLEINRKSVFANRCGGGTRSSLFNFCTMMDMPTPLSKNPYSDHSVIVNEQCIKSAQDSIRQAREEVCQIYGAMSDDEVVDVTISSDGTWQKRGFSSLFGVVFAIEHESGKVLDYVVMSKHCAGCKRWEDKDRDGEDYKKWKETHKCTANIDGSAASMEPKGVSKMFARSLEYKMRFKFLISDGDSKTHSLLLEEKPYGSGDDDQVEKLDCVGHVQKRMGSRLRSLKAEWKGRKLSDGKTIGGAGRLTKGLMDSLQNYYGDAIRRNVGDLKGMMKAVQATLHHHNSSDEHPRHHLCQESWCKYLKAKAKGEEYHHERKPVPDAIVVLLRPIYNALGNKELLERCVHGYTQNPNESIHSTVWKLCPKEMFLGTIAVETASALAVCKWNDGATSLFGISKSLGFDPSPRCKQLLQEVDIQRMKKSKYKCSGHYKALRRKARAKRKGFEDKHQHEEGVMYSAGGFDGGSIVDDLAPGPSKRPKRTK